MSLFKKIALTCIMVVTLGLMTVSPVLAWQEMYSKSENSAATTVSADQIIDDDLLMATQDATFDGTVNGDLLIFAQNVIVNGTVNGDLIVFCSNLTINGQINDDVRGAVETARLNGQVAGNFSMAGSHLYLENRAQIGGNVTIAGDTITVLAPVQGSVTSYSRAVEIASAVGKNVKPYAERVTISPGADIAGNLIYTSNEPASISPEAKIAGEVTHKYPPKTKETSKTDSAASKVVWFLVSLVSCLLIWFVWRLVSEDSFEDTGRELLNSPWATVGWGMLLFFVVPIACLILLVTVIGIPLSLIAFVAYLISIYIGRIIVGSWLGHLAAEKFSSQGMLDNPYLMTILGILIVMLLGQIPILGFWIRWLVGAIGLGCVFLAIRTSITRRNTEEV
ncbi:MAG: hypothetical protein ACM3MK_03050 [Chitinophagales bacterium]